MKPVYQLIDRPPLGDCFRACVASILEVPVAALPNFADSDDWGKRWNVWGRDHNLQLLTWPHNPDWGWLPSGYCIAGVKLPGVTWQHAIVAHDGKLVWNPHPGYGERMGAIGEVADWTFLAPLDPAHPIAIRA